MLGFKPGKRGKDKKPAHIKREGNNFAGGGAISGPGTGISDDISTEVPEGTYIMPADSTEKIGEQQLGSLGQSVPVNLSNGEYQMPPEQVHAVGVQALNQMRDATHTPAEQQAMGFKSASAQPQQHQAEEPQIFFADGGNVTHRRPATSVNLRDGGTPEEERERGDVGFLATARRSISPFARTVAGASVYPYAAFADRARQGAARLVGGDPETLPGGASRYSDSASSMVSRGVSDAAQIADDMRSSGRSLLGVEQSQVTATPPLPSPSTTSTPEQAGRSAADASQSSMPQSVQVSQASKQGPYASGIARPNMVDGVPTFNNESLSGFDSSRVNTISSEAMSSPSLAQSEALLNARRAAVSRGENVQGVGGFQSGGSTILRDTSRPLTTREIFSMRQDERRENAGRAQQSESERLRLDERRLASQESAQGFQVRAAQRLERLSEMYESAGTPEEKAAIAEQIRVQRGDDQPSRFVVAAGGQVVDPVTQQLVTQPAMVFNQQTGEFVQRPRSLPPIGENPAVQKIMNNTSLSREERAKQIRALGYQ